jgi:hypothetical protein
LPAFDTHAYVKRLKLAGFSDAQAEAQSDLQAEVLSSLVTEKLTTKDDLLHTQITLKQEIAALSAETKQEFIRQASKIHELDVKFSRKFNQLHWMLVFLLAINVTVLFKLFHG